MLRLKALVYFVEQHFFCPVDPLPFSASGMEGNPPTANSMVDWAKREDE